MKASEKSQTVIYSNWREDSLLRRRLSSLEAMQRQVQVMYNLDQRLLLHRSQVRQQRSERALTRLARDKERLHRTSHECCSAVATPTGGPEGGVWKYTGMTHSNKLSHVGHQAPQYSPGCLLHPCRAATGQSRTCPTSRHDVAETGTMCVPPRGTSTTDSPRPAKLNPGRGTQIAGKPNEPCTEPAIPSPKHRPTGLDPKDACGRARASARESSASVTRSLCASATETSSPGGAVVSTSSRQQLDEKVRHFVDSVRDWTRQQGTTIHSYYTRRQERPSSIKDKVAPENRPRRGTEDDEDDDEGLRWRTAGGAQSSRSLTMQRPDCSTSCWDAPADLLLLESYCALVTKENLEQRRWTNNNPYSSRL